ncbi:hypothetical protein BC830DRAFT_362827 [Chytriomyces sp. MP71]|nr:hypothetical protein BC830DRAFT_362827 [Chytriomyces sp. MP71]
MLFTRLLSASLPSDHVVRRRFLEGDGTRSTCICSGECFPDANFTMRHRSAGLILMICVPSCQVYE